MRKFFLQILTGIVVFAAVCAVFGVVVMLLWNRLLPPLFGLPLISYWQAVALLVLVRTLFGGIGGGLFGVRGKHLFGGYVRHDNPFREKWLAMNDEERKDFWAHHHDFFRERSKADKTQEDNAGK